MVADGAARAVDWRRAQNAGTPNASGHSLYDVIKDSRCPPMIPVLNPAVDPQNTLLPSNLGNRSNRGLVFPRSGGLRVRISMRYGSFLKFSALHSPKNSGLKIH